jgi:hypothetical protein
MAIIEGDSPASKADLEGLGGENSIKVDVPFASEAYQNYLNSLKEMERQREESGGPTVAGIQGVREAAAGVDREAKKILNKSRSG